ncbi:MAG: DUF3426 domain-containing protein [Xanthomonadales bacterium PRO6]|nr:hypothetical protein [Xanthomonadales bacterium]MCE7930111.1 DUF3426 domain-containing protein [Xanthomonadales bacterium PRO6]
MYTQCHRCLTVYRLQAEVLARARGQFRCGHCGAVFDGLERLIEHLPEASFHELPHADASATPVVLNMPAMRPAPRQSPLFAAPAAEHDPHEHMPSLSARREARLPGDFLHDRADRGRGAPARDQVPEMRAPPRIEGASRRAAALRPSTNAGWWLGSLLLAMLLGAQVAWAERAWLLEDSRVRPWLDRFCDRVGCQLPMRSAVASIRLVSREVRPHPDAPQALLISASMINDASFVQRFPVVEVTLSDLGERAIARRRFQPAEYLADASSGVRGFPPGATAPLVFEVADPGREAVAFEFRFLAAEAP